MKSVDVAVIGGGILGCFAARNLMRWNLSVVLIEKELDICTGITRANSAIVYAGYDNKTGSRKAELTVRGNASFDDLCRELEVPFSRCGSLLVTYDKESLAQLRRKWEQGIRNGVPGLELLTGGEAEAMEPMLAPGVAGALYAPTTGTVNPWQLGIAAFENAAANGMEPMLGTTVVGIRKTKFGYLVETDRSELRCRAVINCAGLSADRIQELCFPSDTHLLMEQNTWSWTNRRGSRSGSSFSRHSPAEKASPLSRVWKGICCSAGYASPLENPLPQQKREYRS